MSTDCDGDANLGSWGGAHVAQQLDLQVAGLGRKGHREDRAAGHLPLHLPKHRPHILLVQHLQALRFAAVVRLVPYEDTNLHASCTALIPGKGSGESYVEGSVAC